MLSLGDADRGAQLPSVHADCMLSLGDADRGAQLPYVHADCMLSLGDAPPAAERAPELTGVDTARQQLREHPT